MSLALIQEFKRQLSKMFNDPVLQKVEEVGNASIYKARVDSMLVASAMKYVVVISVHDNTPIFEKKKLSQINWVSFQTRQIQKHHIDKSLYNLPEMRIQYHEIPSLLKDKITKMETYDDRVEYMSENVPVKIILLTENKDKGQALKNDSTIERALSYFNTIISF
jgi:hypothetical protein